MNTPAGTAERLLAASVQETVERFGDPALVAAGKVNVVSLEIVSRRFGGRWALRKEQVWDFTDGVLQREIGVNGAYLRVSDTDFFVVHPDFSRVAGQAACLRYLREVLDHFLGETNMAAAGVMQVTRITRGRLEAATVDTAVVEAVLDNALSEAREGGRRPPAEPDTSNPSGSNRRDLTADVKALRANPWTPFVSTAGRQLRVSATLEPVYELKGFTRIGFRMIRRIVQISTEEDLSRRQVAALSPGDLLKADMATITRGLGRLAGEGGGERQLSLIVPVSFVSLSSQRGRSELVAPLKQAGGLVKLGVICEILDIEGVPQGLLMTAASIVRPFSLLVVGRLADPTPQSIAPLRGGGLQALSLDCPRALGDAEFMGWAAATIAAAKKVAKSVLIYNVGSPQRAAAIAALGATHVSLLSAEEA